jgi:Calx-beta domain
MKNIILTTNPAVTRVLRGLVASFGLLAASSAMAAASAKVLFASQQFGNGTTIHAVSSGNTVFASKSYSYTLGAKMEGESGTPMAKVIPAGTSLAAFLEGLSPGSSALLKRKVANPAGTLPFTLFSKAISGSRQVKGLGTVKISLKVMGTVTASGQIILDVKNVKLTSSKGTPLGKVIFGKGSKFIVTAAPLVTFSKGSISANESDGVVAITVARQGNFSGTVSVDYATADSTGTDGTHYAAQSGTITFLSGETRKNITVNLVDNALSDGPRTFVINLSNITGGAVPGEFLATTVTIKDND